jgi:hypothetical protein
MLATHLMTRVETNMFVLRENFPFGMRIRIQEPAKYISISKTLADVTYRNSIFGGRLREHKNILKTKFFAKTFLKRNISRNEISLNFCD